MRIGMVGLGRMGANMVRRLAAGGVSVVAFDASAAARAALAGASGIETVDDLAAVSEMWRHGSVVRSWLLDLIADALKSGAALEHVKPVVADSGEGRWTAIEAVEQDIPAPVMSLALMMRFASQGNNDYAAKLLALMRAGFGGHPVQRDDSHDSAHSNEKAKGGG